MLDFADVKVCCTIKNGDGASNIAKIVFEDSGVPFNPLEKQEPDITLSAEERDIWGGLGIFITKKYMSQIDYKYQDEKNILTLCKNRDEE